MKKKKIDLKKKRTRCQIPSKNVLKCFLIFSSAPLCQPQEEEESKSPATQKKKLKNKSFRAQMDIQKNDEYIQISTETSLRFHTKNPLALSKYYIELYKKRSPKYICYCCLSFWTSSESLFFSFFFWWALICIKVR